MNLIFNTDYSNAYDSLYQEKDYEAECDLIEYLSKQYLSGKVKSFLDLGCGTGNHAITLSKRGYKVTGIDQSGGMISQAQRKLENEGLERKIQLIQSDIKEYDLQNHFDAALMMFAVLGYQTTNEDVISALSCARRHLRMGGLLIADMWYGPAVLAIRPSEKVRIIPTPSGQIIRVTSGLLNIKEQTCLVSYHLWEIAHNKVISQGNEKHVMRFFFPLELQLLFKGSGFDLLHMSAFPSVDKEPDESTWNVMVTAKAI